ncbi:fructosamine kinase family protein [Magnetospirillum sp. UT-4]|uniref:fructosamine kinase family protein n=1 Tax=Magnetospirillum sp. UT-4 TaxID=2681467 RepID=UPI00137E9EF5|nr:fructosamine kinase family protein [Magnetospirillum sp. UT-4]CAA7623603.1 Fructosamine kinase [Magnetospirillum sp. UT-4]
MTAALSALVERYTGRRVAASRPMSGGCVGQVLLLTLADHKGQMGGQVVAKLGPGLEPEGWMLRYLASHSRLPVPTLVHADDDLLLMEYVDSGGVLTASSQAHAADLLAHLHGVTWHDFGLERDTVIGALPQPNPPTPRWLDFYRDHRLLHMAGEALKAGRLPAATMVRIETLAARLGRWLEEPAQPSLLHGDAWTGNILVRGDRVGAFIDPALYYGHPEIELAFGTMFGTFGDPFFRRYEEMRPLAPGFWEARRDLYLLYPLLVHVRLFGGSYLGGVETTLDRFVG